MPATTIVQRPLALTPTLSQREREQTEAYALP